jgi:hypothetical protein
MERQLMGDDAEASRCRRALESNKEKFTLADTLLGTPSGESWRVSVEKLRVGLIPSIPLSELYERWAQITSPSPPLTRFFFAALPFVFDVALTIAGSVLEHTRSLGITKLPKPR